MARNKNRMFRLDDFSGGLNTARAEARLDANESPALSNVDLLDSGAIRRRNGYVPITATNISASGIKSLYRYRQKDGDAFWMAVCGTGVYTSTTPVPEARVEAETVVNGTTVTGTPSTVGASYNAAWSAGAVFFIESGDSDTVTASFSIPKSNRIAMRYLSGAGGSITASFRVDSGTWLSATHPFWNEYVFDGLSATTHTVHWKVGTGGGVQNHFIDCFDYQTTTAWTLADDTLSASASNFGFTTLNDVCYYNTDYDTLRSYNGVTATAVTATGAPQGGFMVEHKRRLFTAGDNTDKALLQYSELDDPEDWTNGGSIYLAGKDSGGECTGLTIFNNMVIYFAPSRIYAMDITGPDTEWTAQMAGYNALSTKLGCVAPKSLVQTNNALIFLSDDGVRGYGNIPGIYSSDGSGLLLLSDNIRPDIEALSTSAKTIAAGAFYRGRYWLSVDSDGDGVNDTTYVYKLPVRDGGASWTKFSFGMNCYHTTSSDGSDDYDLFGGDSDAGQVYQMDTGSNDNGGVISISYKTPPLTPDGYETTKHYRHAHVAAESTTTQQIEVTAVTDDKSPPDNTLSITNNSAIQPLRASIPARGRSIQYTISGSGLEQALTLSELTTTYVGVRMK